MPLPHRKLPVDFSTGPPRPETAEADDVGRAHRDFDPGDGRCR